MFKNFLIVTALLLASVTSALADTVQAPAADQVQAPSSAVGTGATASETGAQGESAATKTRLETARQAVSDKIDELTEGKDPSSKLTRKEAQELRVVVKELKAAEKANEASND
jgi:hypothetical protein